MFDVLSEISWIAVIVSTLAFAALGALYFLVLVPRQYVVVLGREGLPEPEPAVLTVAGPMLSGLVMTITSAVLMAALDVDTVADALAFGAIVGFGYMLPMTLTIAINPNFPRPLAYGLLNAPYFLIGSLVISAILQLLT